MRPSTRLPRNMRLKAEPRSAERQAKNRSFTWLSGGLRHSTRFAPAAMSICAASATERRAAVWTGLTPGNDPLILRDVGTEELYSLNATVP